MTKTKIASMLFLAMSIALGAQTISNIRATLEPNCGYYTISYDLSGKSGELYAISLLPYLNNKEITNLRYAGGAGIQASVAAGKDLQVYWHPLLEGVGTGNWQFRLEAKTSPWIKVEGGSFMMGSNDGEGDEKPVHQVTVSSFQIGKHEVTVAEYYAFVKATGYKTSAEIGDGAYVWTGGKWEKKKDANWKNPYYTQTDQQPVSCISWIDAIAYCNWLSIKESLKPCYSISGNTTPVDWNKGSIVCDWSANGYRLPTEAEWEYAARGGKNSKGYKFSGANEIESVAWYSGNSNSRTQPVGTKKANELGIYDISGNVWEWCWDWYGEDCYSKSPNSNPKGVDSGSFRVLRGGGWSNSYDNCRVAYRNFLINPVSSNYGSHGFRVTRAIK